MATAHAHHGHGHGHHDHAHEHHGSERRVFWAAILTAGFMLAEVAGGLLAGSLALVADAAHMLTDAVSLGLAWFAFRIARQPADWRRTYGFDRFQILAAFTNGVVLFLVAAWIVAEAVGRLVTPEPVLGGAMLAIAALGLLANAGVFAILHGGDRENLNVRGAILHVLGDMLGSVAAIVAAGIILLTGWTPADPILSVLVSLLVLRAAWRIAAEAGHILLEGAPAGLDVRTIGPDLVENVPGVADVHHVHAWSLTQKKPLVTLHARLEEPHGSQATLTAIKARLRERFGIGHATVEMEQDGCADGRQNC
jgi:cobalt-zinc-cadmium efflux system protein